MLFLQDGREAGLPIVGRSMRDGQAVGKVQIWVRNRDGEGDGCGRRR